jgi:small nuclear ribonucleoprotein (snRNP)-like protein
MLKRTFAMMLSGILLVTAFGFQYVLAQTSDTQATEKIRAKVHNIGVGSNARIEVKLRDNSQLKGYIKDADQDSFTVMDNKTGSIRTLSYADTSSVKKAGGGLSGKNWLVLGAVAVGAIVTWVIVKPALCDGGAQTRGPC